MKHFIRKHVTFFWIGGLLQLLPMVALSQLQPFQSEQTGLYGYLDARSGKVKIDPKFQAATLFFEKLAKVQTETGWGIIKKNGKYVVQPIYGQIGWTGEPAEQPLNFQSGLIGAKEVTGTWTLIDQKGDKQGTPSFSVIYPFKSGKAIAAYEAGNMGLFTSENNWVIPPSFVQLRYLSPSLLAVQDSSGLWGMYTNSGKMLYPHELEKIEALNSGFAIAEKNGRLGALDGQGKIIQPFVNLALNFENGSWQKRPFPQWQAFATDGSEVATFYADSVKGLGNGFFLVTMGTAQLLFKLGEERANLSAFDEIFAFDKGVAKVLKNNRYGLIGKNGKLILPAKYEDLQLDENGRVLGRVEGQQQLYDRNGQLLSKSNWQQTYPFKGGYYLVNFSEGFMFMDEGLNPAFNGRQFEAASPFRSGFAAVKVDGLYGIIDSLGSFVISPYIDSLKVVNDQYFLFADNGLSGSLNTKGIELFKTAVPFEPEDLGNGYLKITTEGKSGLLNRYGSLILPVVQDHIATISPDSLVQFTKNGQQQYMDLQGYDVPRGEVFKGVEILGPHRQKYFPVRQRGGYGFVDYLGRARVSTQYEGVTYFSEGLGGFKLVGRWGYLDLSDRIVVQPLYQEVQPFKNGFAVVKQQGKYGVIDKTGEMVLSCEYDSISQNQYGNFLVEKDGELGLLSGRTFNGLYARFEQVQDCGNGLAMVKRNGLWGVSQVTGETVLYPQFPNISYDAQNSVFFVKNLLD